MPSLKKLTLYLFLLLLGGGLLSPLVSYATLTLDSTSLTSNGALTLKSASSSLTIIGETNQTGAITVASSSQTLTLNLGTGTGATTINIATGATNAKTVNIGTSGNLTHTITIGSASSSVAISSANWTISTAGTSTLAVPAGAIMFFNLSTCPSGWTEETNSRGRYIVGLPSGGTLASTTGTALTNLENRAVGQHTHGITDPGHTHTDTVAGGGGGSTGATAVGDRSAAIASAFQSGSSTTGISVVATGTTAGTNAPYVQYLVCQKS